MASMRCEEEKARNKSEAETKEKTLWEKILTCRPSDGEVKPSRRFEEFLQQRQVAMMRRQAPDNLLVSHEITGTTQYFLFAAKSEVIS